MEDLNEDTLFEVIFSWAQHFHFLLRLEEKSVKMNKAYERVSISSENALRIMMEEVREKEWQGTIDGTQRNSTL